MAKQRLKCWRKVDTDEYKFKKGYNKDNVKILRIDHLPGKRSSYKYEVYAIGKHTSNTVASFKTKPQALKYVKSYLKKNDVC